MGTVALERVRPRVIPKFDSLSGWWTGDQVTIDTGLQIMRMLDLSGRGNHLEQATSAKQPLQVAGGLNGHNTVLFDGVVGAGGDALVKSFYIPTAFTVYLVVKPITWASGRCIGDSATGTLARVRMSGSSPNIDMICPSVSQASGRTPLSLGSWHVLQYTVNNEESFIKVDDDPYIVASFLNTTARGFTLAAIGSVALLASNIEVAEVIVQHKAAGEAERNSIVNYLKNKYALTFAAPTITFTGWHEPTTFANDALIGTELWQNMGNASVMDGVYATVDLSDVTPDSQYIKATGFGFNIPGGATINGIVAQIVQSRTAASDAGTSIIDGSTAIVKAGALTGNDLSSGLAYPLLADVTRQYGSNAELWGEVWTPADINDPGFGIGTVAGMGFVVPDSCTARIDRIRIGVYYQ